MEYREVSILIIAGLVVLSFNLLQWALKLKAENTKLKISKLKSDVLSRTIPSSPINKPLTGRR